MEALDTTEDTRPHIGCLRENGIRAVGRYYSRLRNWKCIKREEAEALSRAGIQIFAVYQDRQDRAADFGHENGERAAREALAYAEEVTGQPTGSAIYFSVDYDATTSAADGTVREFFKAINEVFSERGNPFKIGVYGSGMVCRKLLDAGLVGYTWLSQSTGHQGYQQFKQSGRWNLMQGPLRTFCDMKVDPDDINAARPDFGGFLVGSSIVVPVAGRAAELLEGGGAVDAVFASVPAYPGQSLRKGLFGSQPVRSVQTRLTSLGYGPLMSDGDFGEATENAVGFFQARNVDLTGKPLDVTGEIEILTWGALFGPASVRGNSALDASQSLRDLVGEMAAGELGVVEQPHGSNRGPEIDEYIRSTGLNPAQGSFAWCVCFLYWVFDRAAKAKGVENPLPKTAGVHALWQMGQRRANNVVPARDATVASVKPGMIFTLDSGGGRGHAGLVIGVEGDRIVTIEGNTNNGGSREGYGVFRRDARAIRMGRLMGYLDFC